jgi:pilus assembly protein Flp/PilA
MKNYREVLNHLWSDESGQDLIEYALVAALVALAAVASLNSAGSAVSGAFTGVSSSVNSAI